MFVRIVGCEMDNLQRVQKMIADDAYAMSFQTMGQYRSALLENIKHIKEQSNDLSSFLEMIAKSGHVPEYDDDNPSRDIYIHLYKATGNFMSFRFDRNGNFEEVVFDEEFDENEEDGLDSLLPYTNEGEEIFHNEKNELGKETL